MSKKLLTPMSAALGVVVSLSGMQLANAGENPFAMSDLSSGYMVSENAEGSCGGMKEGDAAKMHEGKCGDAMKKECAAMHDSKMEPSAEMKTKCEGMMKEGADTMKHSDDMHK